MNQDAPAEGGIGRNSPLRLEDIRGLATIPVSGAAQVLGLGRTAAYEAAQRGDIPTLRIGRRVVVPVPALLRMLGAEG